MLLKCSRVRQILIFADSRKLLPFWFCFALKNSKRPPTPISSTHLTSRQRKGEKKKKKRVHNRQRAHKLISYTKPLTVALPSRSRSLISRFCGSDLNFFFTNFGISIVESENQWRNRGIRDSRRENRRLRLWSWHCWSCSRSRFWFFLRSGSYPCRAVPAIRGKPTISAPLYASLWRGLFLSFMLNSSRIIS